VVALLRLVELDEGAIEIDGVDISQIGLKTLRSQVAIIPQDPVLFSGTVRSNLDPFGEHEDERLWEVVERVGLIRPMSRTSSVASFSAIPSSTNSKDATTTTTTMALSSGVRSLNSPVAEGGCNLSVGQRQLLVIARALLSCCKMVVMDEATASIDSETDHRIQQVMRTEFRHATVLTIAHRINTISDCDFILGLSNGRVLEFDDPASLLAKGGLYKDLVNSWEKERQ
jgi:ABC-type multidrug transport system fused ATPase/permease subunit